MKNKKLVLLSAIVLIVAMTGSAVAYMFRQASAVENTFIPAIVDCEVGETFDGTVKTDIWTTNTGTVDAYIRLRLVTYWADKNGVAVAMEAAMPEFTITGQWLKDASENTYYYKEPVKPKAKTTNLLESNIILFYNVHGSSTTNITNDAN